MSNQEKTKAERASDGAEPSDHSSPPLPIKMIEPKTKTIEKKKARCIFCNLGRHASKDCPRYIYPAHRIAIAQNKHLCLRCEEPLVENDNRDRHEECPKTTKKCSYCRSKNHSTLFCEGADLLNCELCWGRSHDSQHCSEYFIGTSAEERKQKMETEHRCVQCFTYNLPFLKKHNCFNENHVCQLCFSQHNDSEKAAHHPLLCNYFYDNQQAEVSENKNRKRDPVDSSPRLSKIIL